MLSQDKAKYYCCEDISLIENYEKAISDNERMWDCHHRLEIQENGKILSKQDLINEGLYFHRPANELIFLLERDHIALHNSILKTGKPAWNSGKTGIYTEETRKSMGQKKGCVSPFKGKHHSDESKRKNSEAHKRIPPPNKGKKYDRYKCITSDGQIKIMPINVIHRYHLEIIKED